MKLDLIPFPGGTLPAITDDDIGKAMVVGAEPTTVSIIPEQTVNKEVVEGTAYYNPINTDNSAFTLGSEVSLNWNGENLGTATVQYSSDFHINYATFENPETGNNIEVNDLGDRLQIALSRGTTTGPDSVEISLIGFAEKAVWSVGAAGGGEVIHISLVNGVPTMDKTFAEISDAMSSAPTYALWENEGSTQVFFVASVDAMKTGGRVTTVNWGDNSFVQQTFIAESDSDYPIVYD